MVFEFNPAEEEEASPVGLVRFLNCLEKKNAIIMWQSFATWFLRGIRSKGLEEEEEERRDNLEELPLEIWWEVGKRLVSRLDRVRFRSVCKEWRLSLPSPNLFPMQVPLPPDYSDLPVDNVPFFITEVNIYWVDVGSETNPRRVLMEFEEVDEGNDFCIRAFIPNGAGLDSITNRPDWNRGPRLSFVAKAYRLNMAVPYFYTCGNRVGSRAKGKWRFIGTHLIVTKITLISSNADGVDHASYAPASDLSVVALIKRGGKLALLRLGGSRRDPNWEWETGFCTHVIHEIATYKGQLCAIDRTGKAFLMDYNSLDITQIAGPLEGINEREPPASMRMRLFEAHGELYLIVNVKVYKLKVYKLCVRLGKWLEVVDTGDRVLFTAICYNVSIPRDVITSNYGSWMMKYKELGVVGVRGPSILLAQDHKIGYCSIGFQAYILPWFISKKASNNASSTASILSQYENSIGHTDVAHLLRFIERCSHGYIL